MNTTSNYATFHRQAPGTATRTTTFCLVVAAAFAGCLTAVLTGCRAHPPGGAPIQATPIGTVVDELNRRQEENAEPAKFIVYMHEFELNKPFSLPEGFANRPEYEGMAESFARGFRLNPAGQDHVKQIASQLLKGSYHQVVVERSNTSKLHQTAHRYPVHFNDELDQARREVVVDALSSLGVSGADQMVLVAPAYPTGLYADEAAAAYQQSRNSGQGSRNGGNGGGGFGGGGIN